MAEIEKEAHAAVETPFEAILEEHREISRAIQELKDLLNEFPTRVDAKAGRTWRASLSGKLLGLRDKLLRHFCEEERSGLYEALTERLPSIARRVQIVREDHEMILGEIAAILAMAAVPDLAWPSERLRDRTEEVLYQIVHHEQKESDLIARAYLEDLGNLD